YDIETIKYSIPFDFKIVSAIGALIVLLTGLGSIIFGEPFLTQTFATVILPFLGEVELSTVTFFELGVALVVVGVVVAIILSIIVACVVVTFAVYLLLSKNLIHVIIGTDVLTHAVHLLIMAMGGFKGDSVPIANQKETTFADALPQALVLTSIVISFAVTS